MAAGLGKARRGPLGSLHRLDRALLLVGLPLWLGLAALSVQSFVDGNGYPPLGIPVFQADDEYPVLEVLAPMVSFEDSALEVGDRLIRVGGFDLRGINSLGFFVRFVEAAGGAGFVEVVYERGGVRAVTTSPAVPLRGMAPILLLLSPSLLLMGVLLLFASPRGEVTRRLFHAALVASLGTFAFFGGAPWKTGLALASMFVLHLLAPALIVRFLVVFPRASHSKSLWTPISALAAALMGFSSFVMVVGFPISMNVGVKILPPFYALTLIAVAVYLTRTYRSSEPLERRQMKWVLYGFYAAALPPVLAFGWIGLAGGDMNYAVLSQAALVMIPIAFYIAITRANLFDIDRLISATMSFNVLAIGVIAVALVLAPRVASAASNLLGIDPSTGQVGVSALIAGLAVPLQNALRPRIEGLFFREMHALDVGIGELLTQLASCTDPGSLARGTGEGLMRLVKPETCALYAREQDSYVALFAAGAAVPPALEGDTPLVATLAKATGPLVLDERTSPDSHLRLDAFDRAVLETLGAHVVVPITRAEDLALILCLGPKRSGDVYTPTDVALLSSLAHAVSQSLQRFDLATIGEETRRLKESLRRYVPGAVADEIDEGHELEATTREVSLLFVDLRGYTTLSESREAEQIFGAISRYTESVSESVRTYGGTVVEFNGDGMMAVFGAPRSLEAKEEAALAAAREVVSRVPLLQGPEGDTGVMRPGVGIATGPAFIGNIRAADRLIWTAIGNTTNLAARLEGLTRDLDADIVIDSPTRERVGEGARDFTAHPHTSIRGRSGTLTIYAWRGGRARDSGARDG